MEIQSTLLFTFIFLCAHNFWRTHKDLKQRPRNSQYFVISDACRRFRKWSLKKKEERKISNILIFVSVCWKQMCGQWSFCGKWERSRISIVGHKLMGWPESYFVNVRCCREQKRANYFMAATLGGNCNSKKNQKEKRNSFEIKRRRRWNQNIIQYYVVIQCEILRL